MKNKAVFFDRDGTLIREVDYKDGSGHKSPRDPSDVVFLPTVLDALTKLSLYPFKKIIITNQSGIARGLYNMHQLHEVSYHIVQSMRISGATIDAIYWCPHAPEDYCSCRKPSPEMLIRAARDLNIDLTKSWMIGNTETDILAGFDAGCRTILVNGHSMVQPDHNVGKLIEAINIIIGEK